MKLKPCPFCGNDKLLIDYGSGCVRCPICGARTGTKSFVDDAEAAWNRRVVDIVKLLNVAEVLEAGWTEEGFEPDEEIELEDVNRLESEMAEQIRKAVGE